MKRLMSGMCLNINAIAHAVEYALGNSQAIVGYSDYNVLQRLRSAAPYQLDQFVNFVRRGEGNLRVD